MKKNIILIIVIILVSMFALSLLPTTNYSSSLSGLRAEGQLPTKFGVTFSPMYAKYLGLDFKKTYLSTLDELNVKYLRIPTYWSKVEETEGKLDFTEIDFMVDEASKREAKIMIVLGIKQPRWPECHIPDWARKLSTQERGQKALNFIETVVNRYKDNQTVVSWQVENEPYVAWFGENCDPPDSNFLRQEIELVKKLDPNRSIIITDTGEWSTWRKAARYSDTLGISVYRKVFNPNFGFVTYPFPPYMYTFKSKLIGKKTIIAELQAEPWAQKGIMETGLKEQLQLFTPSDLQKNVEYAKKIGFGEIYLWGVEWWFYMKNQGHMEYLDYAKSLF